MHIRISHLLSLKLTVLAADMAGKNLWARTITVKVKLHTFDVLNRSKSLHRGVFVQEAMDLVAIASGILRSIRNDFTGTLFSVRLLGIRCTNFKREEDMATSAFNIDEYFRGSPEKKSGHAQRSLDFFFSQSKGGDDTKKQQNFGSEANSAPEDMVQCPICEQVSFRSSDNSKLNRHIDTCLGPTKPKKKRKLSDFWT